MGKNMLLSVTFFFNLDGVNIPTLGFVAPHLISNATALAFKE